MGLGRQIWLLLAAVALVAGACSTEDDAADDGSASTTVVDSTGAVSDTSVSEGESPASESEGDAQSELLGELAVFDVSDPLDLTFDVATELSSSVLIASGGGSVTATDIDGVIYTLTIPQDALLTEEEISVTPILNVEGLPFGGPVFGVHLEPAGLILLHPALLTIELPSGVDAATGVAFGTFAGGADFHLTPWTVDGSVVATIVDHFSFKAVGGEKESLARDMTAQYEPTSNKAVFDERMALIDREYGLDPDGHAEALGEFLELWTAHSVIPSLFAAAEGDDTAVITAWMEAESWERAVRQYEGKTGDTQRFADELSAVSRLVEAAIKARIEAAYEACLAGDVDEAARMLMWETIADQNGLNIYGARRDLLGCLTFKLSGFSLFEGPDWHSAVSLEADLGRGGFRQRNLFDHDVEIVHEGFSLDRAGSACDLGTSNGSSTVDLDISINLNYLNLGLEKAKIEVNIYTRPEELMDCPGIGLVEPGLWYTHFISARGKVGTAPVIELEIVRDGDLFAESNFAGPVSGLPSVQESSGFQLVHTPTR